MNKEDLIDYVGKNVKLVLNNNYFYKCLILSVGDDFIKIRDIRDTTYFIVLSEIKILEVNG